jgi:hypothetical protein
MPRLLGRGRQCLRLGSSEVNKGSSAVGRRVRVPALKVRRQDPLGLVPSPATITPRAGSLTAPGTDPRPPNGVLRVRGKHLDGQIPVRPGQERLGFRAERPHREPVPPPSFAPIAKGPARSRLQMEVAPLICSLQEWPSAGRVVCVEIVNLFHNIDNNMRLPIVKRQGPIKIERGRAGREHARARLVTA